MRPKFRLVTSFHFVAVALLACLALGEANAQVRDPNRPVARHDADGDGKISPEEWPRQNFKQIDRNRDGFLTPDEFTEFWGSPVPGRADGGSSAGEPRAGQAIGRSKDGFLPGEPLQWIDTHVHTTGGSGSSPAHFRDTVGQALAAIGDMGFAKAILMPTPQLHPNKHGQYFTLEDFIGEANNHPERFAFLGGGGTLNPMINKESPDGIVSDSLRMRFEERAEEILSMGAVGFGEMTALHFSLAEHHPFESVPADHPLFLLLAEIAARHDVPIDLHIEPVVQNIDTPDYLRKHGNPKQLKRNVDGLEKLLAHDRKAKFVWAHAGTASLPFRTPELTQELMERHPNLYLQIGIRRGRVEELRILGKDGVKPEWLALFEQFSDRIVLGGDQFYSPPGNRGPSAQFAKAAKGIRIGFQRLLASLPLDLARKIGHENAIRIYKLDR